MAETWRTRFYRWAFNWFPVYRGTGGRITYIAGDMHEMRLRIPLNWTTRNYVGTIFGGSMYGAVDPIYMLMLIKLLGPDYIVWDKSASIQFRKPGREQLYATFKLSPDEVAEIRTTVDTDGKIERLFAVDLVNAVGEVHATCQKLLSIRRKKTR